MSAEWPQVRAVLESALDRSPEKRKEYLREACGGDQQLHDEVVSLLRGLESDPAFMESPAEHLNRRDAGAQNSIAAGAALSAGDVLGDRYEILKQLGQGGMGTVYKARDRELDRLVALKVIRAELSGHPEVLQRFKQELILSRQVTHRNVIRIYDLGVAEDRKFITMEFVEGQDLKSLVTERGKLAAGDACDIVRQICLGLEAAHNAGVVHRDLKPQNIMLDAAGRVYLMDFGLARSMELVGMTRTGALMGTPAYMSPEQARGEKADARTDLFALGVIFYELLTGILPYQADTMMATLIRRTRELATPPNLVEPAVPQAINDIVMKCLQISVDLRYQHAQEILRDLTLAQPELPVASRQAREILEDLDRGDARGDGAGPVSPAMVERQRRKAILRRVIAPVLALLMAMLAVAPKPRHTILRWARRAPNPSEIRPSRGGRFVAVLPFQVVGDQAALEFTADGIVEALSANLLQLKNVHLATPAAAAKARSRDTADQVARSLGVTQLVRGSVQSSGGRISVVVNLDEPLRGRRLWSHEFSGLRQDQLKLQDQIYQGLVAALDLKLGSKERAKGATHLTENIAAYEQYLKARRLARAGQRDEQVLKQALDLFDGATKKDPSFALAYTGIVDTCLDLYNLNRDHAWTVKAQGAANRAQVLNDNLPVVHFALGNVFRSTGKNAEAVAEFERALELAPNSDESYRLLGRAYLNMGRTAEALEVFQRAVDANPSVEIYSNLGIAYFYLGRYDEARAVFEKAVQLQPDEAVIAGHLADCFRWLKQADKARLAYERAIASANRDLQANPNDAATLGNLAAYHAKQGDSTRALELIREARGIASSDAELIYQEALIHALADRRPEALRSLEEALENGYSVYLILADPELRRLRQQPEFQTLMTKFQAKPGS